MNTIKKILVLDATNNTTYTENAPNDSIGPIDVSTHYHLNILKTYDKDVYDPDNALIFGCGPFAGSQIGGVYRATFFARSPLWKGLFSSNMGGVGIALYKSGFDFFILKGKAKNPTIISVSNIDGKQKIEFKSISKNKLKEIYSGYKDHKGTFALERYAFNQFKENYRINDNFVPTRSLATGPASSMTDSAGIVSTFINKNGEFETGREDWAGRGGFGSLMVQGHNIVAIVIGGNVDTRTFNKDLRDRTVLNQLFNDNLGKNVGKAMMDATVKYRYIEDIKSGGTFGVNFSTLGSSMLSFNWSSVKLSETKRKEIYKNLIKNNYLKEFNKNVIDTKSWKTCGELCPALCKKIDGKSKIDYEPYEANGPNCGIFNLKKTEKLVGLADEAGFDAIHIGTIISFVLEAKSIGLLTDKEISGTPDTLKDILENKKELNNQKIAENIINLILKNEGIGKILKKGIRSGSKELDKIYPDRINKIGTSFNDLAVYVPNGIDGEIAPNQYWVPGFFIPLPIQGKFLTYYGSDFLPPEQLGEKSAKRFILEFQTDNLGICRFHRGWSEKMKDTLLEAALGIKHDQAKHIKKVIKDIVTYDIKANATPQVPESMRVKEMLKTYLLEMHKKSPENKEIAKYVKMFEKDIDQATKTYFIESKKGINKVLDTDL